MCKEQFFYKIGICRRNIVYTLTLNVLFISKIYTYIQHIPQNTPHPFICRVARVCHSTQPLSKRPSLSHQEVFQFWLQKIKKLKLKLYLSYGEKKCGWLTIFNFNWIEIEQHLQQRTGAWWCTLKNKFLHKYWGRTLNVI